MGIDFGLPS